MREQACGSRPGDDPVLMDVAAMTRGNQLAVHIIADNVRAPPGLSGDSILLADNTKNVILD